MNNSSAFTLILISAGLFYTFISPQYDKIKALQAQAGEYANVIQSVNDLKDTRDSLLTKYQSLPKSELDKLGRILPDHVDTVKLALDIDTIASKYGISIKNIKVDSEIPNAIVTSGSSYETIKVNFNFITSYSNFRRFLTDLEASLRLIDITSIGFDSSDNGLYQYEISFNTYWLK
jgi:Tfp pilus assembly protein PilO